MSTDKGERPQSLGFLKLVVLWKCLQQGSFSQRNRPVLNGMAKPSVAVAEKLSCHGRRRNIPFHPPVHGRECCARFPLVASSTKVVRPISPRPPRPGVADSLKIDRRESACPMRGVDFIGLPRADRYQSSNRLTNSLCLRNIGCGECNRG